jgi:hypothetical protein
MAIIPPHPIQHISVSFPARCGSTISYMLTIKVDPRVT